MTNVSIPEVNALENSSTLAITVQINLSVKLDFLSVNGPIQTYFVDALLCDTVEFDCANFNSMCFTAL